MAIEVNIQTAEARQNVESLIGAVDKLKLSLKEAYGEGAKLGGFSFAGDAVAELRAMRSEFAEFSKSLLSSKEGLKQVAEAGGSVIASAQAQAKAVVANTQAMQQQTAALKAQKDSLKELAETESKELTAKSQALKIAQQVIDADGSLALTIKELNSNYKEWGLTEEQVNRALQITTTAVKTAATDAEILTEKLAAQNAQFNLSADALLRQTQGWATLSAEQQQSLLYQHEIAQAITTVSSVMKEQISAEELFIRQEQSLGLLRKENIITEKEYAAALQRSGAVMAESLGWTTEALAKSEGALRIKQQQIDYEDRVAVSMKRLTPVLQEQLSAMEVYSKRITDIKTAQDAWIASNGKLGLSEQEVTNALARAKTELAELTQREQIASTYTRKLATDFDITNQSAAAFRASLEGTGLGFGIFTGATIAVATAAFAFARSIRDTIELGSEYEAQLQRMSVFSNNYTVTIDTMGHKMTEVKGITQLIADASQDLSTKTEFSAKQYLEAATKLQQASVTAEDTYASLKSVADLATITGGSLVDSASTLVTVSHLFDLSFQDAARTVDTLTIAATSANTTVGTLEHSLVTIGPTARQAGLGVEEVTAALATLMRGGFEERAGTGLRSLFSTVEKETPAAKKALADLGLSFKDFYKTGTEDAFDLIKMLELLEERMKGESLQKQLNITNALFRTQGQAAANFLLQHLDMLKEITKAEQDQVKNAEAMADAMRNNVLTVYKELGNEIKNIEQDAFAGSESSLYGPIKDLTEYLKEHASEISSELSDILSTLVSLTKFMVEHAGAIKTAAEAYLLFKTSQLIIGGLAAAVDILGKAWKTAAIAATAQQVASEMGMVATATATATAGMTAFGTAGRAAFALIGGWPTIIAGGLIAIGYAAYKVYDSFQLVPQQIDRSIASAMHFQDAMEHIGSYNSIFAQQIVDAIGQQETALNKELATAKENIEKIQKQAYLSLLSAGESGNYSFDTSNSPEIAKYRAEIEKLNLALSELAHDRFLALTSATLQSNEQFSGFLTYLQHTQTGLKTFEYWTGLASDSLTKFNLVFNALGAGGGAKNLEDILRIMKQIAEQRKSDALDRKKEQEDEENKARARELATQLRSIITEYSKLNYSPDILLHGITEINNVMREMNKNGSDATLVLEKMGVSRAFAQQAIDAASLKTVFDQMKIGLVALDPAFSKLKQNLGDNSIQANQVGRALEFVDSVIEAAAKANPRLAEEYRKMGDSVKASLTAMSDGTYDLKRKFDDLATNAPLAFQKMTANQTSIEGLAKSYGLLNDELTKQQRLILAESIASSSYQSFYKDTGTEVDKLNAFIEVNNELLKQGAISADTWAKAYKNFYSNTPTGQLEKENENLSNQIQLLAAGATNLSVYNSLWQATKGDLSLVTEEMLAAAVAQEKLNEEMEQIKAVQSSFKTFADSMSHTFRNVLDGTDNSFKKLFDDIKGGFKNLLLDMVEQAFKNQLLFSFGFASQGNTQGFLQSIFSTGANVFGGIFGAGGAPQQQPGQTPAQTPTLDFTGLLSAALQRNIGYNTQAGATGSFGGTDLLSLVQAGKAAYGIYTGFGNAAEESVGHLGDFATPWTGNLNYGGEFNVTGAATEGVDQSFNATANYGTQAPGSGLSPLGIAGSVLAGYGAYQAAGGGVGGLVGGVATGIGTYAIGAGVTAGLSALAGGATLGAGASAAFAAIPVVGWVAIAAMVINAISGGALFGTSWKATGASTTYDVGSTGIDLTSETYEKRKKAFFGGTARRTVTNQVDPEAQRQARQMYDDIAKEAKQDQDKLGVTLTDLVSGSFKMVYDNKGNLTDQFSTVLGVVYHESIEDFATRLKAENEIKTVGESIKQMGGNASEASRIAAQYRSDATVLKEAADAMLLAQLDIKNGVGLLQTSAAGTLTKTMDIVASLSDPGEKLSDTYTRLVQSTAIMDAVYQQFDVTITRSREDFIEFSAAVVKNLGGVEAATQAWNAFSQSVFSFTEQIANPKASTNLQDYLDKIGLAPDISIGDFKEQFQKNLPQLNDNQLADWIKAGSALGTINNSLKIMGALSKGFDLTGLIQQQQTMVTQVNALIQAAAAAGASQEQLAELEREAAEAVGQQLISFMEPIEEQLSKFTGRDYTYQLHQIETQMRNNIIQAEQLGASEQQLADIRALAAYQEAKVISDLEASLAGLIEKFNSSTVATDDLAASQTSGTNAARERSRVESQAAQDLFDAQMARYEAEQEAIKDISDFIKHSLVDALSPLGWQQQLQTAKSQFEQELILAKGGDVDAIKNITQYAQTYLEKAQSAYGNDATYGAIFSTVMDALKLLSGGFNTPKPADNQDRGGSGSSRSGGGGSTKESVAGDALSDNDKYQLAIQIAQQIGQLGLALKVDVFDLMEQEKLKLDDLLLALHIDLKDINDSTITNLKVLNGSLGTKMIDLLTKLEVTPAEIGNYFQISAEQINAGNLTSLKELSSFLGTDMLAAINYIGGSIKDVTKALGLDIEQLNADSADKLIEIAKTLGTSTSDLMTALGISTAQLAEAFGIHIDAFNASMVASLVEFADKFGANLFEMADKLGISAETLASSVADAITAGLKNIDGLPADFTDGIKPYLKEIADAKTPEDLKKAYEDTNQYLSNLPTQTSDLLKPLFEALGFNIIKGDDGIGAVVDATENTNSHLGDINNSINDGFGKIKTPIDGIYGHFNIPLTDILNPIQASYNVLTEISSALNNATRTGTSATSTDTDNTFDSTAVAQLNETVAATATQQANTTTASTEELLDSINELNAKVAVLTSVVNERLSEVAAEQGTTTSSVDALHSTMRQKQQNNSLR